MSLGLLMKVNFFNHHSNAKCLNTGWNGKLGKHVSVVIGQFLYRVFKSVLEHFLCNFNKFGPKNNWDAFKQDIYKYALPRQNQGLGVQHFLRG
jgi:hypothetical protein